jgi:hypothetical protein
VAIGSKQSHDFNRFIDRCNKIQKYNVNALDILAGKAMAKLNNILRLVFYKFVIN